MTASEADHAIAQLDQAEYRLVDGIIGATNRADIEAAGHVLAKVRATKRRLVDRSDMLRKRRLARLWDSSQLF